MSSLMLRVNICTGSGYGSRTDSDYLAFPGPVLEPICRVRQGLVTPVFEFNSSLGWIRLPGMDEVSSKSSLCLELGCILQAAL